jgi:hypothetical protein
MDSSSNESKSKNGRRIGYLVVLFVILTAILAHGKSTAATRMAPIPISKIWKCATDCINPIL